MDIKELTDKINRLIDYFESMRNTENPTKETNSYINGYTTALRDVLEIIN